MDCERITPYTEDSRIKHEQVRDMFDSIAPAYDRMNRLMTFGLDRLWTRRATACATASSPRAILDVATGTADIALRLSKCAPQARITGIDLSEGMLAIGRRKVEAAGLTDRILLRCADCLDLPFGDDTFDAVTVAYGVRNFDNLAAGYSEMLRVLRPGGTITVIELATPASPVIRPLYNFYAGHIIPLLGRFISKDVSAYSYLPKSIAAVPQRDDMTRLMDQAGFTDCRWRAFTFGVCCLYTATKPH